MANVCRSERTSYRKKAGNMLELVLLYLVLAVACVLVLYPLLWVASCSFKASTGLVGSSLIPDTVTLDNYKTVLTDPDVNFPRWIMNTVKVSVLTALAALAVTTPAAYAFSRMRFPGRRQGLIASMIMQMFPSFMAIVALYTLLGWAGLIDTYLGLIIVYVGGAIPFSVWLLKGYFDSLPKEIEESAMIDGATRFQAFVRILLPLAKPILYVVGLVNFLGPYSEYIMAQVIITSTAKWTSVLGMRSLTSSQFSTQWASFSAVSVLTAIPIVIVFLSAEQYIVSGMTQGAIK
ncbi:MAG: sugar ABC transporter permease [Clostridia bacterium]|nr:sugar ABC transporter permease [Clostridia bacterium]